MSISVRYYRIIVRRFKSCGLTTRLLQVTQKRCLFTKHKASVICLHSKLRGSINIAKDNNNYTIIMRHCLYTDVVCNTSLLGEREEFRRGYSNSCRLARVTFNLHFVGGCECEDASRRVHVLLQRQQHRQLFGGIQNTSQLSMNKIRFHL